MVTPGELFAQRYRVGPQRADFAFVDSFEALDEKLHRRVILTWVKDRFTTNPAFVEQFSRHARESLSVVHPAIARTYDVGTDGTTGLPYMVTELPVGQTLHERLKSGPLDTHAAASLIKQAALGLAYASSLGRHHLGLSPKHMWVSPAGKAVVTGLGVAALAAETAPTADFLASASHSSGYLAPEQIVSQPSGEFTDIYALAITLSEALCARPTWDRNLRGDDLAARASLRPVLPGSVVTTVPGEIDQLIALSTQPRPEDRTLSLNNFAETLSPFIAPTAEIAEVPSVPPRENPMGLGATGRSLVATAAMNAPAVASGMNPQVAKLFPAASLSDDPFTLNEFIGGRSPRGFMTLLGMMVGAVVVLAALILVVVSTLPANFIPNTTRAVPGVIGYSYEDAAKAVSDSGLVPIKVEAPDPQVAAGIVISVAPAVGTKVEVGAKVSIIVSLGAKTGVLPDVRGMTIAAAKTLLTKLGFAIGTVTEVANGASVRGTVISSKPAGGETVATGTKIDLTQASGKVTIPSLIGKPVSEATTILGADAIGLSPTLKADTGCLATNPATVKTQSAGPGEVSSTTVITLTYCTGH